MEETKKYKHWTRESCLEAARNYETLNELKTTNMALYSAMMRGGWLKDAVWLKKRIRTPLTYEYCRSVALKCKSKAELRELSKNGVYAKALKMGWLKDYDWLVDKSDDENLGAVYTVYRYLFPDNFVYIGITMDVFQRDYYHRYMRDEGSRAKNSPVLLHVVELSKKNGGRIEFPAMEFLGGGLVQSEAREPEDLWIELHRKKGFHILNSGKTGYGVGSVGNIGTGRYSK